MKKAILNIKAMKIDSKILLFNIFIMTMTIFALLSYYGSTKGKQYESFFGYSHSIYSVSEKTNLSHVLYSLTSSDDFTFVIQDYDTLDFNGNFITPTYISENFDFKNNVTGNEILENNEVLVHNDFLSENNLDLKDFIEISGNQYIIAGSFVHNFEPNVVIFSEIPYLKFVSNHVTLEFIVKPDLVTDLASLDQITNNLELLLQTQVECETFESHSASYLREFKIYTLALFAASTINFLYLYQFILSRKENKMRIYKITGASNNFILRFITIDLVAMFSISYLLSIPLTLYANLILLPSVFDTYYFYLTPLDYIQYYFLPLFTYLIFVLFYHFKKNKKSKRISNRNKVV